MTTLALRLAGPLQAWGTHSRFVRRDTGRVPTKSGVVGLLAAARGLGRTDDPRELGSLRFGVRADQPGRLQRDFQTAVTLDGAARMPLSYRYYLADAAFLAVVEGDDELLRTLAAAVERPHFPLYLGRRSCPPSRPLTRGDGLGLRDASLGEVLHDTPWLAPDWHQRAQKAATVELTIVRDVEPGEPAGDTYRDEPLSFDPRRREYGWRPVTYGSVPVTNPYVTGETLESTAPAEGQPTDTVDDHDAMGAIGDAPCT